MNEWTNEFLRENRKQNKKKENEPKKKKPSTHIYDQETGTQEEIYNNIKK